MTTEAFVAHQVPERGSINLDHLAHFVPDIDAASAALAQLGFTLTPFSPQSHRLEPGGPLVPAGTGNRCVMLRAGYLEVLTPTGAGAVADQLRQAIARYVGVHLVAFGTAAPESDHARLAAQGFRPLSAVALERPISTEHGEDTARFTVVRVPPGTMAEGRIQYCRHHTPELVWQRRWLHHANGASGLAEVLICVADVEEAAVRYSRFSGLPVQSSGRVRHIETARGNVTFIDPPCLTEVLGLTAPALPWIAGYALESADFHASCNYFSAAATPFVGLGPTRVAIMLPAGLGGVLIMQAPQTAPLAFD